MANVRDYGCLIFGVHYKTTTIFHSHPEKIWNVVDQLARLVAFTGLSDNAPDNIPFLIEKDEQQPLRIALLDVEDLGSSSIGITEIVEHLDSEPLVDHVLKIGEIYGAYPRRRTLELKKAFLEDQEELLRGAPSESRKAFFDIERD